MAIADYKRRLEAARIYSVPGVWGGVRDDALPITLEPLDWVEYLTSVARGRGIRIKRKTGPTRWTSSTTATGRTIRLAAGFERRPALSRALTLAHELHHCSWQLSYRFRAPVSRWIARWTVSPDFRWETEAAAECDEFWLYGLLTKTAASSIPPQAARAAQRLFKYYRLPRDPARLRATEDALQDALRAGRDLRGNISQNVPRVRA